MRRSAVHASWIVALSAVLIAALAFISIPPPTGLGQTMQAAPPLGRLSTFARQLRAGSFLPALGLQNALVSSSPSAASAPFTTSSSPRTFTNTTANMADNMSFLDAVVNRRSIYGLQKSSKVSDERIKEIVTTALNNVPSSFNSQSTRLVVLLKEDHDFFWDTVTEILKAHVPPEQWEHTGGRMTMFKAGYGTILFYEDPTPVKALQEKLPQYADKFPPWSEHTSAMHQYMLWTALEAEGLGCNLQHYNPLADQKVAAKYDIPLEWSQKAQLVFGDPADEKREKVQAKTMEPVEKKLKIFGA